MQKRCRQTLDERHTFFRNNLAILQKYLNLTHNMNTQLMNELQKECHREIEKVELRANTSFQEHTRRELKAVVEKAERLEMELHTVHTRESQ
jgi:hypothetical protein